MEKRLYWVNLNWARLFTSLGRRPEKGPIASYDNLIDGLLETGAEVGIVLDADQVPQIWQDQRGGWDSRDVADAFMTLAYVSMMHFSDRVSAWRITATMDGDLTHVEEDDLPYVPVASELAGEVARAYHKALAVARAVAFARALPGQLRVSVSLGTERGENTGLAETFARMLGTGRVPASLIAYAQLPGSPFRALEDDVADFVAGVPDAFDMPQASVAQDVERDERTLFERLSQRTSGHASWDAEVAQIATDLRLAARA